MKVIDLHQDISIRVLYPHIFSYGEFGEDVKAGIRESFSLIFGAVFPLAYTSKVLFEVSPIKEILLHLSVYRELDLPLLLSLEGCYGIELHELPLLCELGVKSFGLTWNRGNDFASGAMDSKDYGLTDVGKGALEIISANNCLIDLAHLGERAFWDVLEGGYKNVFVSHTGIRDIVDNRKNVSLEMAKAVAEKGGVVGVSISQKMSGSWEKFVSSLDLLFSELSGAVALGSDLYGTNPETAVFRAREAPDLQGLFTKLEENFSKVSLEKLAYKNAEKFLSRAGVL